MPIPPNGLDERIAFNKEVGLRGQTGSLSVDVFGGPLARVQAAIFDANNTLLTGVGFGDFGPPLTTENGGRASWLFHVPPNALYMKWSVQAVRSAAGLGSYSVTAKVRNSAGDAQATGQFSATIPDGEFSDSIIFDGVKFSGQGVEIPKGPNV